MKRVCILAAGIVALSRAELSHAEISSTSGAAKIVAAPADVRTGKLEDDTQIPVFPEQQNTTSGADILLDITIPGTSPDASGRRNLSPGSVPAGQKISSYFIHFDKVGHTQDWKSATGSVTFSETVLGLIISTDNLKATHASPGLPGTLYPTGNAEQVEVRTPGAFVTLSSDLRTVSFNLVVNTAADNIRVITGTRTTSTGNNPTGTGPAPTFAPTTSLQSPLCGVFGNTAMVGAALNVGAMLLKCTQTRRRKQ